MLRIVLMLLLGSMSFSAIVLVESEIETHDLDVSLETPYLKALHHLSSGSSTVLNATVVNKGNFTEHNVNLQLLINGTIYLNTTARKLLPWPGPGNEFWAAYLWAPEDGVYNVTAYAPPIKNETYALNNQNTRWVWVCPDQAPVAAFTFEPEVPPNLVILDKTVTFNASASHDDLDWGTILNYTWDFDDGTPPITEEDPIIDYTFTRIGNFNVNLTIRDTENKTAWTNQTVIVDEYPVARFSVSNSPNCKPPLDEPPYYVNCTLTFDASASNPDGGWIVNYTWDFDDGSPIKTYMGAENYTATHIYNSTENYNVTLTVTDNLNLTKPWSQNVLVVLGRPVAKFIIKPQPPYYVNVNLTFDASASYDPDNYTGPIHGIANYTWDFDDGTPPITFSDPIKNYNYTIEGTYNVRLNVTDYDGLKGTQVTSINISLQAIMQVEEYGNTTIVHNPKEPVFDVNITIYDVEDLFDFEFKLRWPPTWLPPESRLLDYISVKEGDFLGDLLDEEGRVRYNFRPHPDEGEGYILINCTFKSYVPKEERSGKGTLAIIEFQVLSPGNCTLSLSGTRLINSTSGEIGHILVNGTFYTETPVAKFNYSPPYPSVDEPVTFNASLSYDPDNCTGPTHGITNYTWDFGDGTTPQITTNPIILYAYKNEGTYNATLTVADYANKTWSTWHDVPVGYVHDMAVINVEPCVRAFNETTGMYETAGKLPINVVVKNKGEVTETFNVTIYANETAITLSDGKNYTTVTLTSGSSTTLTIPWDTAGVAKGNYTISAYATPVPGETNTTDNTFPPDGPALRVRVLLAGDINNDGSVNMKDIGQLCIHYGAEFGDSLYVAIYDVNCDGKINMKDIGYCCIHYGKEDP